jgi:hypothetical protein
VKCGDQVLLLHATTGVWLHTRRVVSHLDHGFEVSGADSDNNEWNIECEIDDGPTIASQVRTQNALVGCYLSAIETAQSSQEIEGIRPKTENAGQNLSDGDNFQTKNFCVSGK